MLNKDKLHDKETTFFSIFADIKHIWGRVSDFFRINVCLGVVVGCLSRKYTWNFQPQVTFHSTAYFHLSKCGDIFVHPQNAQCHFISLYSTQLLLNYESDLFPTVASGCFLGDFLVGEEERMLQVKWIYCFFLYPPVTQKKCLGDLGLVKVHFESPHGTNIHIPSPA